MSFDERVALVKARQATQRAAAPKYKQKKEKPETGLVSRAKETAKLYPWVRAERNNRIKVKGRTYGLETKGSSDFICIVTMHSGFGRFVALEAKRPGEKPTPEQQAFIDDVNALGGYGKVFYSIDEFVIALHEARDGFRIIKG